MEDPANCASAKQKSAAFEWLRKVAIGQSEDAEHAAVMMYEVVNLRAALEPFADIRAANIDALPDSAGFAARSNGRHVTYGDIRAAREVLLSNDKGKRTPEARSAGGGPLDPPVLPLLEKREDDHA